MFGQMDEPPGVRLRVALSALTMAEYFRDVQNQDVLLFVDNIFRFVQAGSEVSTLLGRMPSAVGYQPTLADEMGELQERITSTRGRSITSLQAVYVPADDYTDPAPFTTFTHLDATTELSRQIAALGIYPAVDPLASTSTILAPEVVGERHYDVRPPRAGDPAALQGAAGHHRHPRPRRAVRGGPRHREPGPQGPAVPVAAVLRRPRSSPASTGDLRAGRGDGRELRGARQRRARRRARAGVPQRRRRRAACWPRPRRCRRAELPMPLAGRAGLAGAGPLHGRGRRWSSRRTLGGGEIAFLPGHAPFLGALDDRRRSGSLRPTAASRRVAVHGGFVEVSDDQRDRSSPTWPSSPSQIDVARAATAPGAGRERLPRDPEDDEAEAARPAEPASRSPAPSERSDRLGPAADRRPRCRAPRAPDAPAILCSVGARVRRSARVAFARQARSCAAATDARRHTAASAWVDVRLRPGAPQHADRHSRRHDPTVGRDGGTRACERTSRRRRGRRTCARVDDRPPSSSARMLAAVARPGRQVRVLGLRGLSWRRKSMPTSVDAGLAISSPTVTRASTGCVAGSTSASRVPMSPTRNSRARRPLVAASAHGQDDRPSAPSSARACSGEVAPGFWRRSRRGD